MEPSVEVRTGVVQNQMSDAATLEIAILNINEQLADLRHRILELCNERENAVVALQAICSHDRGTEEQNDGDYHRPQRWRVCRVCNARLHWNYLSSFEARVQSGP